MLLLLSFQLPNQNSLIAVVVGRGDEGILDAVNNEVSP